LNYVSFSIVDW